MIVFIFLGGLIIMPGFPLSLNDIFIGDIFGFVLALPISLFMAFWLSAVKKRAAVVVGAFLGALIAFVGILVWANSLPSANGNGGATFFGSLFFCSAAALVGGIITDLLVARITSRDYRRSIAHE
jgi:hypothetical protein